MTSYCYSLIVWLLKLGAVKDRDAEEIWKIKMIVY
jgi:hypothetical protein